MRRKLWTGWVAALAAVLLPLLICGMGRQEAGVPEVSQEPVMAQETATVVDAEATQAQQASGAVQEPAIVQETDLVMETDITQAPGTVQEPVATAASSEVEPSAETLQERKVTAIIVHQDSQSAVEAGSRTGDAEVEVTVEVDGEPETMALNDYLTGVLMGEMPASYPLEALKAQAVAARTYTIRRMEQGGTLSDDPTVCQAYIPVSRAEEKFGDQTEEYLAKLQQAVTETDGQVLTYDGELIAATYFSCSGGKTESAQAVWGGEVPYLVSVDSPGEEDSSSFSSTESVDMAEFLEVLGITSAGISEITYTDGGGVDTIVIGGKTFTGLELRELFGLRSTRFTMEITADTVSFSVQGYGHRVGMSQNGARVMAEAGNDYTEILKRYYTGVEITQQ